MDLSSQNLSSQKCVPCEKSSKPLSLEETAHYLPYVEGWDLVDNGKAIVRSFQFKNFKQSLEFVSRIGAVAEEEGHHPDITFGWGYCTVLLMTHNIKGLHENDFIMAVKINALLSL